MYEPVQWDVNTSEGFGPQKYLFFKIKVDKAVNAFNSVNSRIGKIAEDIETIKSNLTSLEEKFNEYSGLDEQMNSIRSELESFKESLIDYNQKLLDSASKTCDAIAEKNDDFFNQATNLKEDLAKISAFQEVTNSN